MTPRTVTIVGQKLSYLRPYTASEQEANTGRRGTQRGPHVLERCGLSIVRFASAVSGSGTGRRKRTLRLGTSTRVSRSPYTRSLLRALNHIRWPGRDTL